MPYLIKKNAAGKFCVHLKGDDGEAGANKGCSDSMEMAKKHMAALYAAEGKSVQIDEDGNVTETGTISSEDATKCYAEADCMYVPYGITSLADAIASEEARKQAKDIKKMTQMFEQVVSNVLSNSEIENKKAALADLADELREMVAEEADDIYLGEEESVDLKAKRKGSPKPSDYLVIGDAKDPKTWSLPVKENGTPNHRLMGAAYAALTGGYRGNKYEGSNKDSAFRKLKRLYKREGLEMPSKKSFDFDELGTIKSLSDTRVGGYAVLWGSKEKKDLTGEYFTSETEELTTIFDSVGKLPFIYQHTLNEALKSRVIGLVDTLETDSIGLWYEAELKQADEYDAAVRKLIAEGRLKTSTQTFGVAKRVDLSGFITRWPIVEISATPTPAEPRMLAIGEVKGVFAELGIDVSEVVKDFEEVPEEVPASAEGQGAEKARLMNTLERERLLLLSI